MLRPGTARVGFLPLIIPAFQELVSVFAFLTGGFYALGKVIFSCIPPFQSLVKALRM